MVLGEFEVKLSIINYGLGNLRSVEKAFQRIGQNVSFAESTADITSADKLILPGVGHFAKGIENLKNKNFWDALNEAVLIKQTPILGICLGMQLMTKFSEEGNIEGFAWINGDTKKFQNITPLKTPHMGWNSVELKKDTTLCKGLNNESSFYFVHSYYVSCEQEEDVLMKTTYGHPFVSGFEKGNIMGVQFHPEKSHKTGLSLLQNFISL